MIPHRDWLKSIVIFAKLPELSKRIKELEDMIKILKGENRDDGYYGNTKHDSAQVSFSYG